jgi:hypothetical protein
MYLDEDGCRRPRHRRRFAENQGHGPLHASPRVCREVAPRGVCTGRTDTKKRGNPAWARAAALLMFTSKAPSLVRREPWCCLFWLRNSRSLVVATKARLQRGARPSNRAWKEQLSVLVMVGGPSHRGGLEIIGFQLFWRPRETVLCHQKHGTREGG